MAGPHLNMSESCLEARGSSLGSSLGESCIDILSPTFSLAPFPRAKNQQGRTTSSGKLFPPYDPGYFGLCFQRAFWLILVYFRQWKQMGLDPQACLQMGRHGNDGGALNFKHQLMKLQTGALGGTAWVFP